MKAKEIVQAINDVDDKYVEEAANYKKSTGSSTTLKLWRIIAIAACVCLAGSVAFTVLSLNYSYDSKSSRTAAAYRTDDVVYEEAYDAFEMDSMPANMLYSEKMSAEESGMAYADVWDGAETVNESYASEAGSKMIYTVWMDMQTREFDEAVQGIDSVVKSYGGYFSNQHISNNANGYRNASFTARVPAENLDAFLEQVGNVSTITFISRSAEDVSENYFDTESRLETARKKLERLQELLAEAEDMEDLIAIEEAISDVEWEIDLYSGSLRYYDSQIAYSTVDINLSEVYEVVKEEAPMTFGEKISKSFDQGIKAFGQFIQNLVIWLANSWIAIIIVAAIAVLVVVVIRKIVKKHRK